MDLCLRGVIVMSKGSRPLPNFSFKLYEICTISVSNFSMVDVKCIFLEQFHSIYLSRIACNIFQISGRYTLSQSVWSICKIKMFE